MITDTRKPDLTAAAVGITQRLPYEWVLARGEDASVRPSRTILKRYRTITSSLWLARAAETILLNRWTREWIMRRCLIIRKRLAMQRRDRRRALRRLGLPQSVAAAFFGRQELRRRTSTTRNNNEWLKG